MYYSPCWMSVDLQLLLSRLISRMPLIPGSVAIFCLSCSRCLSSHLSTVLHIGLIVLLPYCWSLVADLLLVVFYPRKVLSKEMFLRLCYSHFRFVLFILSVLTVFPAFE